MAQKRNGAAKPPPARAKKCYGCMGYYTHHCYGEKPNNCGCSCVKRCAISHLIPGHTSCRKNATTRTPQGGLCGDHVKPYVQDLERRNPWLKWYLERKGLTAGPPPPPEPPKDPARTAAARKAAETRKRRAKEKRIADLTEIANTLREMGR